MEMAAWLSNLHVGHSGINSLLIVYGIFVVFFSVLLWAAYWPLLFEWFLHNILVALVFGFCPFFPLGGTSPSSFPTGSGTLWRAYLTLCVLPTAMVLPCDLVPWPFDPRRWAVTWSELLLSGKTKRKHSQVGGVSQAESHPHLGLRRPFWIIMCCRTSWESECEER